MKPQLQTNPADWVEIEGRAVVYEGEDGRKTTFKQHYELNEEAGELEPTHPPIQEWATRVVIADTPADLPDEAAVVEEVQL